MLIELRGAEAHALEAALGTLAGVPPAARARVERGDGFQRLKAWLPPAPATHLIDPPYEGPRDFGHVTAALAEGLRFRPESSPAGTRSGRAHHAQLAGELRARARAPLLASELAARVIRAWRSTAGLLIVNPPHLTRAHAGWLPQLVTALTISAAAGSSAQMLSDCAP